MHVHISAPRPLACRAILADVQSVQQLQEKLVRLNDSAHAVMNRAQAAGRDMTADEAREVDSIFAEFEQVEAQIKRHETLAANEERLSQPQGRISPPAVPTATIPGARPTGAAPARDASMTGIFATMRDDNGGFSNEGDFLRAVAMAGKGHHDNRLMPTMQSEGVGEDGGFLVPPAFTVELLEYSRITSEIAQMVTSLPLTSNNMTVAGFGTEDHSNGAYANLRMLPAAEASLLTNSKAKLRSISLVAKKSSLYVPVSNELLTDAPAAAQELRRVMMEALASYIEKVIISGSGAGEPLGILNGADVISVAKEGSQTADTLLFENIANMFRRLHPNHLANSVWVTSQTTLTQLISMFFPVTEAGSVVGGQSVFNVDVSGRYSLLGRPVLVSEHSPVLGDAGDIMLCDPSQYLLAMKPQLAIEASQHALFDYDMTAFRLIARMDGASRWKTALTPATGTETISAFVTLAERA